MSVKFGAPEVVQLTEMPSKITGGELDKYFEQALELKQGQALKMPIETTDPKVLDKASNRMNTRLSTLTDAAEASKKAQLKKLHIRKDKEKFALFIFMGSPRVARRTKGGK